MRRVLAAVVSVGIAAAVFALALPAVAKYGAVGVELRKLSTGWAAGLAAVVVANVATSAFPWMAALPGLRFGSALRITQASTALITVLPGGAPAGMAASFAIARSRGINDSQAALAVALTGIWSQLSTFLFPFVALIALATTGSVPHLVMWFGLASAATLVLVAAVAAGALVSTSLARLAEKATRLILARSQRLLRRRPSSWDEPAAGAWRKHTLRALRARGAPLTIATLANQLTAFVILDLSIRAVGIGLSQLSVADTFAAWSLGRLIESLPLTPGGIGLVELSLVGTLVGFGAPHAPLVAGVLLYRALVVLPTLAIGTLSIATSRMRRPQNAGAQSKPHAAEQIIHRPRHRRGKDS
ncbi:MAG: lysylphosphatidylglycerol synthase transmembrane domain-containing protein [Acetobacteraceae bacterium]